MNDVSLEDMIGLIRERQARSGYPMQPPCPEPEIVELRRRVKVELRAELLERYLDVLRLANGIDHNGLRIFGSRTSRNVASDVEGRELLILGIIDVNNEYRNDRDNYDQLLVYAETEAWVYAQVIETGKFIKLLHSEQEATEEYDTFDDMMIAAIGDILV